MLTKEKKKNVLRFTRATQIKSNKSLKKALKTISSSLKRSFSSNSSKNSEKIKKSKKSKVNAIKDDTTESIISGETVETKPYYTIDKFHINFDGFDIKTDMLDPTSKAWLSNFQISYPMYMVQNQYPFYNILFRSCHWELADEFSKFHLMYNTNECIIKENTFIILRASKNHWVLLTNHKTSPNTWSFYDSIGSPCYLLALAPFFKSLSEIVETDVSIVESMSIQTQKGIDDCGLFALANLISICKGIDPCSLKLKQNKMREHYNSSIDNVKFEMFPHETKTVRKNVKETNIYNCNLQKFN